MHLGYFMWKILAVIALFSSNHVKSDSICGDVKKINNSKFSSANWPWLTSLFYYFNGEYFCSGTLISEKHVLSGEY